MKHSKPVPACAGGLELEVETGVEARGDGELCGLGLFERGF